MKQYIEFKNDFFISRHGISEHNVQKIVNSDLKNKDKFPLTKEGRD